MVSKNTAQAALTTIVDQISDQWVAASIHVGAQNINHYAFLAAAISLWFSVHAIKLMLDNRMQAECLLRYPTVRKRYSSSRRSHGNGNSCILRQWVLCGHFLYMYVLPKL